MTEAQLVRAPGGTVALYVSYARERTRDVARSVARALRDEGFRVATAPGIDDPLALATPGASFDEAAVVVTVGGDGTLLRAAQLAVPLGIPLFGINTGRLGFLTEIDAGEGDSAALVKALREGFVVEERLALEALLHGRSHVALNDVVVRRSATGHMAPFGLFVDGKEAAMVPADGVVIATPTGSTAYLLSAGGPILAPNVAALGIVALAPHTLFTRPLVVPDSSRVTIESVGEFERATLEADGAIVDELGPAESVEVRRYSKPVRFARRGPRNFFALLEDKLRWNAPIKGRGSTQ